MYKQPGCSKSEVEPTSLAKNSWLRPSPRLWQVANMDRNFKPNNSFNGYTSKPYLGKPHPPQLAPGVDVSLDLALTCQYCNYTGHLKENCVKLT